jgi:4-hydroxy-tetrahydrodipicolinate synthase
MTSSFPAAEKSFRGIWPALLTPLTAGLGIDHAKFAAHCKALIASGCPGVTAFGTTGEGPSFSLAERKEAIDQLIKNGIPAKQIMVSTSCAALPETLELTRHAVKAGVHGCLMLPPFFLKGVSDQGIIDSYRYVIDGMAGTPFKLYLYHIPQVTGVPLSHHVIATLKQQYPDTIVGIKDSACSTEHSVGLANAFMKDMTVYVGFEPDLPEMGKRGSTGAISGLANFHAAPRQAPGDRTRSRGHAGRARTRGQADRPAGRLFADARAQGHHGHAERRRWLAARARAAGGPDPRRIQGAGKNHQRLRD